MTEKREKKGSCPIIDENRWNNHDYKPVKWYFGRYWYFRCTKCGDMEIMENNDRGGRID